ncbi:MAG TPA: SigE family RNA polymerase sigma factor [Acidimicrobiales bacterium]
MGLVDPPDSVASAPQRFEDFYRAQHEPMLRLAYLLTQSRAAAEDLVQDSFIRVQPRWDELEVPTAYLRRTVTNACYSWHRRRRLEQATPVAVPAAGEPEHDEMWDALAKLAPRRRAALVLRYYLDLSEADIAAALGCRKGTVKSLTHRALAELRSVLEP